MTAPSCISFTYAALRAIRNGAIAMFLLILPAHAEQVTIAALGDSLTAGYGLAPAEGFVPQLQAWLQAKGADVVVLNAGVSGDTTAGGAARLDWTLTPDVGALIVTLGGNDLLRGIDPAESRANLDAILKSATGRGLPVLLIGMQAPGNYGPDYKSSFDAIYPELAQTYKTLLAPSFFAGLGDDPVAARGFLQADGLHPNPAGVAAIVENLGPQVLELLTKVAN
ncbi:MAG: arylesterase [Microgenomates group bacterium]